MRLVGTLVDNDQATAVDLCDFTRSLVKRRPVQARQWRVVEMTFDDCAYEGRLTKAMSAWYIELATSVHCAITVVVGFAFE